MDDASDFRAQQRAVAIRMFAAVGATILTVVLLAAWSPSGPPPPMDVRLRWLGGVELIVGAWLAATIANVARLRFFSPTAIGGGSSGSQDDAVGNANSILQNTLEQGVLASLAYSGVAFSLHRPVAWLIAFVTMFSVGRILFIIGFPHGARRRALGFALTFYPTTAALAVVALVMAGVAS